MQKKDYEKLCDEVGTFYGFSGAAINHQWRKQKIVRARWCVMWVLRKKCKIKYLDIAHIMKRDHTTVLHGVRQFDKIIKSKKNADVSSFIEKLSTKCN